MNRTEIAVVLIEQDPRLAVLVTKYLAGHSILVTTVRDPAALDHELDRRHYVCVLWASSVAVEPGAWDACDGAGIPLIRIDRLSARDMLARVLELVPARDDT